MGEKENHGHLYVAMQLCINCKWFEHWEGVCCNSESSNRGAFMWEKNDTCGKWEAE